MALSLCLVSIVLSLLVLLAGLLQPDCGRIVLDSRTLFDATAKINLPLGLSCLMNH